MEGQHKREDIKRILQNFDKDIQDYSRHNCLIEAAVPSDFLLLGTVYKNKFT